MRVTFVLPEFAFHPGGGPQVVYEYANGLAARDHEVTIVWRQSRPGTIRSGLRLLRRELRNRRLGHSWHRRITWFDLDPRVSLLTTPWGADDQEVATRLPSADVLVATFWSTWGAVERAAPAQGRPLQLVQSYETWAAPKDTIDRILRADAPKVVIAPSLARTLEEIGVPAASITIVPNGVDQDVFHPRTPILTRPPGVALLVSTTPVKRLGIAVEVLEGLRARVPALGATGFGSGPRPRELPEWVGYLRQPSRSVLATEVLDRWPVFLTTSSHEGWGLPAVEAMRCGCVLVSTRNGGVENFAVHDDSALLCAVDDVDGLVSAAEQVLTDPALRARLSAGGVRATAEMSWAQAVGAFERVITAISDC